ncbi:MAG: class I SAM-dependent RNA methyltransferase [Burkholderiaceae bacterium]
MTTDTSHGFECFAPCPRGLEKPLAAELESLGASETATVGGGVTFNATQELIAPLNKGSRLASRILIKLTSRRYRTDKDLYKIAHATAWEDWFDAHQTLRVDSNAVRASIGNLNIATLRVKDAIVDRLREQFGERPDIDTRHPQVRVFVFLTDKIATLYLDTSGDNLFKRGWRGREDKGAAPLKENLAAGLLALAQWSPGIPLLDPFCGSGTIVIEAAQQSLGVPPGNLREFGYERLNFTRRSVWEEAAQNTTAVASPETADNTLPLTPQIYARDLDPAMVGIARANTKTAGAEKAIASIEQADFMTALPPDCAPGMMISNPPYGERMDFAGKGASVWRADEGLLSLGRHLREHYAGWKVCLLSGDLKLPGKLGLKASRRIELFNGPIEARLFIFEMRKRSAN